MLCGRVKCCVAGYNIFVVWCSVIENSIVWLCILFCSSSIYIYIVLYVIVLHGRVFIVRSCTEFSIMRLGNRVQCCVV